MIFKALLLLSFVQERKKKKNPLLFFSPLRCFRATMFHKDKIHTFLRSDQRHDTGRPSSSKAEDHYIWGAQCLTLPTKIHFESFSPYNYLNSHKLYQYLHGIFSCPCSFAPPESLFGFATDKMGRGAAASPCQKPEGMLLALGLVSPTPFNIAWISWLPEQAVKATHLTGLVILFFGGQQ